MEMVFMGDCKNHVWFDWTYKEVKSSSFKDLKSYKRNQ